MRRTMAMVTALGLLLAVSVSVGGLLLWSAGNQRETATNAATARAEAYGISQLEWRAIAAGAVDKDMLTELTQRRSQLSAFVDQLDRAGIDPARTHSLRTVSTRYADSIAAMFAALENGDVGAAEEIDEQRVDPAFAQVEALTEDISLRADRHAHQAMTTALVLVLVILLLTVAVFLEVLRRAYRRVVRRERDHTEAAAAARFAAMVRDSADATVLTDTQGRVLFATPALARMMGREGADLIGSLASDFVVPEDIDMALAALSRVSTAPHTRASVEVRVTHADGSLHALEAEVFNAMDDAAVAGLVWNVRDVTERRRLEERVTHQAFHDAVTGVANRALLSDRSALAVARAERAGRRPGMLLLDLDGFKDVNDTLGHAAGDQLLRTVAARLQTRVRAGDTVARFGGDEFAVLMDHCESAAEAVELAQRLRTAVAEPVEIDSRTLRVTASVGVVLRTDQDGGELLRCADLAMYAAKGRGKDQVALFEPSMRSLTEERVQLTADLREAVAKGQITLVFQPVIDLQTESVSGFEALARWQHPVRGVVPPLTFIPLAEESGAILEIGRHVLQSACAQLQAWTLQSGRRYTMSVNVSGRQLADIEFPRHAQQILAATGVNPGQVTLEITETAVIEDVAAARSRLTALRLLGVRVAIDDFGTGYSSLSYLRSLPIDILKIDKSFVEDDQSTHGNELLAGIVALGNALDLETVAEGIELPGQADRLRAAGCQQGQGYHYCRPQTASDIEALYIHQPTRALARR